MKRWGSREGKQGMNVVGGVYMEKVQKKERRRGEGEEEGGEGRERGVVVFFPALLFSFLSFLLYTPLPLLIFFFIAY